MRARLYRPTRRREGVDAADSGTAGIGNVHPGEYVMGSIETADAERAALAREFDVVVASVDYRLAPQTDFPGALHVVYAGLCF